MEKDIEIIVSQFRNEASGIFLMVAEDFERHAKRLNRRWDENVFQQLQSRYVQELKKQLSESAEKIINQYKVSRNLNILKQEFTRQIAYHTSELLLKIRSM